MEFLSQYSWIISLIGLFMQFLILIFCQNKNPLNKLKNVLNSLFKNDNISSLITKLLVKSESSDELLESLRKLIDYIEGDKKNGN